MSIISLSLNEEIIKQLDSLQKERGFSGRSETVRAAIRLLAEEQQQRKKLQGMMSAMLLVTHDEDRSDFAAVRHKYSKNIRTQLHDHLNGECMELLILKGEAKELIKLAQECESAKGVRRSKLVGI